MEGFTILIAPALGLLFFLWISNRQRRRRERENTAGAAPRVKWLKPLAKQDGRELPTAQDRPSFKRFVAETTDIAADLDAIDDTEEVADDDLSTDIKDDKQKDLGRIDGGRLSFGELINRFTDPQKFSRHQAEKEKEKRLIDAKAANLLATEDKRISKNIDPEKVKNQHYASEMDKFEANKKIFVPEVKDEEAAKRIERIKAETQTKKHPQKKKLFRHKRSFIEAVIMKEILGPPPNF